MKRGRPVTRTLVLCTLFCAIVSADLPHHEFTPDGVSKYYYKNGTSRSCQPILQPNFCGKDHHIIPCTEDGLIDQCVQCEHGTVNLDISYSDFPIECYTVDCPEGTVPAQQRPSPNCDLPCTCDEFSGYTGSNPCHCTRVSFQCGENTYLKDVSPDAYGDGVCQACEDGMYKQGYGYGPCLPVTPTTTSTSTRPDRTVSLSGTLMTLSTVRGNPTADKSGNVKDSKFDVKPTDTNDDMPGDGVEKVPVIHGVVIAILVIVSLLFIGCAAAVCIKRRFPTSHISQGHIVNNISCLSNLRCIFPRTRQLQDNNQVLVDCPTISTIPEQNFPTLKTSLSSTEALLLSGTDGDETDPKTVVREQIC